MSALTYKRVKIIEVCLFFCVCFVAASYIAPANAPDELMRYPIAQFIYETGTLPTGMEDSLINDLWGFSYAVYPYLTSIISAFFMKIVSFFAASEASLLIAARLTSVFAGTGTLIMCFKIGEQLFEERHFSLLFTSLVGFLPQFVFLSSYQNNDSFAVFTASIIIYFWIRALKTNWSFRSLVGIGVGCGLCALSYYNAYAYLLCTIILYFADRIIAKATPVNIMRGAVIIFVIAFAIGGWFFMRNAALHDGDFLGLRTTTVSAELYAADGYKPSQLQNPRALGMSFADTFFRSNRFQTSSWVLAVAGSFIGNFGNMSVRIPVFLYLLYFVLLLLGFLGFVTRRIGSFPPKPVITFKLLVSIIFVIVVNLALFMYSCYTSDYQAQGRYMMPSLLPIMLMITEGFMILSRRIANGMMDPGITTDERFDAQKKRGLMAVSLIIAIYLAFFLISYFGFMLPGCK